MNEPEIPVFTNGSISLVGKYRNIPKKISAFQDAEISVVEKAATLIRKINIDSQVRFRSLASKTIRSKPVMSCQENPLWNRHIKISFRWVPGNSNLEGKMKQMTKLGAEEDGIKTPDSPLLAIYPLKDAIKEII